MKRIPLILAFAACALAARAEDVPAIADNSFLVEEAYNQEPGVVQHISTFQRATNGDHAWASTFTQEWPAPSLKHQLSYTLTLADNGAHRGFGDVAVNYRYQLLGDGESRVAISPRVSLLLPTGSEERGLGEGSAGVQVMLPISTVLTPKVVAHWNAGATFIPDHDSRTWTAANSFVWLAHPRFNALVETVWTRNETNGVDDDELVISPGVRWSYNFASGLQIVPGVAVPMTVDSDNDDRSIFLYLSFEHPFRRAR
jgi:hypothetical protein